MGLATPHSETQRFVSYLSVLVASAIAFALVLQGVATFIIDPCDR